MRDQEAEKKDEVFRLLIEHNPMLSGYLYSIAEDWHVVEDALQETAVYVGRHWDDFRLGTNFGAWARAIAQNCCRAILQHRRREEARTVPMEDDLSGLVSDEIWDREGSFSPAHREALTSCLQQIRHTHRRAFDLFYARGRGCDEIAALLRKRVGTVYAVLSRVRKTLRACVERRMSVPGGAA